MNFLLLLAAAGFRSGAAPVVTSMAVFCGGYTTTTVASTDLYSYIGNTVSPGTNLTTVMQGLAATGTSTFGLFGGGAGLSAATFKYTYSGNTVAAGTNLGTARQYLAAAGNATTGIFIHILEIP
jgi:hypothetical protein